MAYFSNGSEGEGYQERYCEKCLHDNFEKGIYCPIWNLHLLDNYKECNNKHSYLHELIPRQEGSNGRCTMFVDRGLLTNLQIERFEHEKLSPQVTVPEADHG
jgi:hypothetical protein